MNPTAMNSMLSKEDCAEIYHALGCAHAANLQLRIGFDGERLSADEVKLMRGDAQAIYRALQEKRERVLLGAYDSYPDEVKTSGTVTFEMNERIGRILDTIGLMGENLNPVLRKSMG